MKKIIVAGGRDFYDIELAFDTLDELIPYAPEVEIVSGNAKGADSIGEDWATERGHSIILFPAAWDKYGKKAGYLRNEEMAEYADTLVAFWDGESKGTKHMIDIALREGLEVHVYRY